MPVGDCAFEERAEERVMGAAEEQRVGVEACDGGVGVQLGQIDLDDLGGDGHLRWGRRGLRRT
jgi:hypothetical protein